MVNELGEVLQGSRQTEGVAIVPVEEGKADTEFQEESVHPLLDLESVLHFGLARDHPCEHDCSSLLIKPLA